jgi:seryl-tRNA synthetase
MSGLTPEDRELDAKQAQLAGIENDLAERELDFVTLQNELRAFEARYLHVVGRLAAELDELQAQIAEAQASRNPQNRELQEQASDARARATESSEAVGTIGDETALAPFAARDDLKKVYREIAKLLHPDLTTDDTERARRTRSCVPPDR